MLGYLLSLFELKSSRAFKTFRVFYTTIAATSSWKPLSKRAPLTRRRVSSIKTLSSSTPVAVGCRRSPNWVNTPVIAKPFSSELRGF